MQPLSLSQFFRVGMMVAFGFACRPYTLVEFDPGRVNGMLFLFILLCLIFFRNHEKNSTPIVQTVYKSRIIQLYMSFFYAFANFFLRSRIVTLLTLIVGWMTFMLFCYKFKPWVDVRLVVGFYLCGLYMLVFSFERTDRLSYPIKNFKWTYTKKVEYKMLHKGPLPYVNYEEIKALDFIPSVTFYLVHIFKIIKPPILNALILLYNETRFWRLYIIIVWITKTLEKGQYYCLKMRLWMYLAGSYTLRAFLFLLMIFLFFFGLYRSGCGLYSFFWVHNFTDGGQHIAETMVTVLTFVTIRLLLKTEIPLREEDRIIYSGPLSRRR